MIVTRITIYFADKPKEVLSVNIETDNIESVRREYKLKYNAHHVRLDYTEE
jgi:hypothetical protein